MIARVRMGAFASSKNWLMERYVMESIIIDVPRLAEEVAGVEFGDKRLTKRLTRVVEAL